MPTLTGIIFDLDGTLLDSAPDLRHAVNATLAEHGLHKLDLDQITGMTGDGMMPLLARAFKLAGKPVDPKDADKIFQQFIAHYQTLKPDISQVYPGVMVFVQQAYYQHIPMGVCTNKQETETHRLLQQLGIDKFFKFVAGGDTYLTHKPHPDHVLGVMKQLGSAADCCVMIGDSHNDIIAAKAAKIKSVGVTHGYGGGAIADLGADILVGSFAEIPAALTKLGFGHPLT